MLITPTLSATNTDTIEIWSRGHTMKLSTVLPRLVVAVTVLSLLAGCTMPRKDDPTMNHLETKAELINLFAAAQKAVGGDWDPPEDGGAEDCTLHSGATGAQYAFLRLGPGVPLEQQQKVIDAAVLAWTKAGFKPTVSTLPAQHGIVATEVGYPASGYGVDGLYMVLRLSTNGTALQGQTRCVPGDAAKINSDRVRNK